jgi:alpha-L-rhamnosidase
MNDQKVKIELTGLLCEYASNPLGIDAEAPRFSWTFNHSERGHVQSGYRILVASIGSNLDTDFGDAWDSGRVASDQSVNLPYEGIPLESCKEYFWKVQAWDESDRSSSWSGESSFEMGLLSPTDWKGKWIQGGNLLRKAFTLDKGVERARAYVCGLGYYELRINGRRVGDHVLEPGWTDYEKRALYTTYDVTDYLRPGENAIGVMLGNGRFNPPQEMVKRSPIPLRKYGKTPILLLQLNLELDGGSHQSICTDETWRTAQGPVVSDDIWDGETYDARLELPGWDRPGFDDADWKTASPAEAPGGRLVSQADCPPIKVVKRLQPRKISIPGPDIYIYDFEQNFTGWISLKVRGPRGTEVRLRFAELLSRDGNLNTIPNREARATDLYILKGEGLEIYEPRFTYHGFRYVELTGYPGIPNLETLEGCVVHSAVEPVGSFTCSNELINTIHRNVLWSQVGNLMSTPTDCPQRDERMGWMGDAQLTAEEAIYNFGMAGFYTKYIADIAEAQRQDGSLPDVVPPYWSLYPADPAWGTACVVLPWHLYLYYGDRQILQKSYGVMKGWVDFLGTLAADHIVEYGKFGDWCAPRHAAPVDTPVRLTSTWHYCHDALVLSKIAGILGNSQDEKEYSRLSERVAAAFNREFLQEDRYCGVKYEELIKRSEAIIPVDIPEEEREKRIRTLSPLFVPSTQAANVLALALDLVPDEKLEAVRKSLADDIVNTQSNHLNTGIVSTKYLFDVLTEAGYGDLAFEIVTQTTYPGYGYMIQEGATTLWERWEYLSDGGMNSHNHIMYGTVDTWFYRALAGICVDPENPGWQKVIIKPYPVGNLTHAGASIETIRGKISSSWILGHGSFYLKVSLPGNCRARVSLPKMGWSGITIKESGSVVWDQGSYRGAPAGIASGQKDDDSITFEVGSGSYTFELTGKAKSDGQKSEMRDKRARR